MNTNWPGPIPNDGDDVPADPKSGGLERLGTAKDDDDVPADPKSGGIEHPAV